MSKDAKKVPALRFKGFSDAWEKRKLGELLTLLKDGTHGTHKKGCFAFLLSAKNVTRNKLHFDDTDRKISKKDFDEIYANYHLVQNDILVTIVGTIGRVALFPKLNVPIAFQRSVAILRPKNLLSPGFLALELQTHSVQYQLSASSNMSAQAGIYLGDLKRIIIAIPESQEQDDIANTLFHLNDLIAATQGKFDQLQMVKKALLQHLFDQSMRFKGYSDPWEKRKLGQIAEILMGQSPDSKNYTTDPKDYILVQGNADIKNGWVYPRVWTTQVTKIAKKGSVLLSVRAPVGEVARSAFDVVWGRGVASIGHDDFLYHYLVRMKENGFWLKLSTGSTFDSINSKDIKEAALFVPEKPEQQKISRILNSLNHLIAATQSKLSSLESLKKPCYKDFSFEWERLTR
ncbi:restriction endonuclease subunit S [Lacticaseibacillus zeae]|uniref:restriction endonuclease subunit S n=1 Tax=Lacticaseibacillus zeae TaxID=57037 RepID=UPI001BCB6E10|nr:restriction endonuclease subunit S [Lacticaseibacillus zeae]QVI31212.1 restriction endonuclease subunit S [Lacticaseibacillus zeae]